MFFPIKSNHRHCGIENPSWAEVRHFVNFLDSQLQACEESSFCNMELVGDTLEGFRSFVVRFMILMSRVRYIFITRVTQFHQTVIKIALVQFFGPSIFASCSSRSLFCLPSV